MLCALQPLEPRLRLFPLRVHTRLRRAISLSQICGADTAIGICRRRGPFRARARCAFICFDFINHLVPQRPRCRSAN